MKMKRIFLVLFCAALLFAALALSPSAEQNVVFVSDSGDNQNSGLSAAEPVKTLTQAFQKLGAGGGTVVVCNVVTIDSKTLATFPGARQSHHVYQRMGRRQLCKHSRRAPFDHDRSFSRRSHKI